MTIIPRQEDTGIHHRVMYANFLDAHPFRKQVILFKGCTESQAKRYMNLNYSEQWAFLFPGIEPRLETYSGGIHETIEPSQCPLPPEPSYDGF